MLFFSAVDFFTPRAKYSLPYIFQRKKAERPQTHIFSSVKLIYPRYTYLLRQTYLPQELSPPSAVDNKPQFGVAALLTWGV